MCECTNKFINLCKKLNTKIINFIQRDKQTHYQLCFDYSKSHRYYLQLLQTCQWLIHWFAWLIPSLAHLGSVDVTNIENKYYNKVNVNKNQNINLQSETNLNNDD